MINNIRTLTNQELNKKAKEVVKEKFKANGATVIEKDRTLLIKTEEGKNIEVLVKSIEDYGVCINFKKTYGRASE